MSEKVSEIGPLLQNDRQDGVMIEVEKSPWRARRYSDKGLSGSNSRSVRSPRLGRTSAAVTTIDKALDSVGPPGFTIPV